MRSTSKKIMSSYEAARREQSDKGVLNVALVGCGAVAAAYYGPGLAALEKAKLVQVRALVDPDPVGRMALQKQFPRAATWSGVDRIAGPAFDLAVVASPPRVHAEQTLELLQAGVPVLCEKPMATSPDAAEAMIAGAARSGQLLAIGMVRRFFPVAQMVKDLIAAEAFGPVRSFTYAEGDPFTWPAQSDSFFRRSTAQGGVLLDLGVHVLDLLHWWFGTPVGLEYADDAMGGVEANCRMTLAFAEGYTGDVRLSRDGTLANRLEIHCERGVIRWDVKTTDRVQVAFDDVQLELDGAVLQQDAAASRPIPRSFEQSFLHQLLNVTAAVRGQEEVRVPGAAGLPSLQLIDRCYATRRLLDMEWLGPDEQAEARRLNQPGVAS
jgi:predicted dehydrogenase